jgi:hypothetical protein
MRWALHYFQRPAWADILDFTHFRRLPELTDVYFRPAYRQVESGFGTIYGDRAPDSSFLSKEFSAA